MASIDAYLKLDDVDKNRKKTVVLNGKTYRIRAMGNAVAERRDRYVADAQLSFSNDGTQLIADLSKNRKLVPKCLSLMLLGSFLKVTFFHFIYWRYLHYTYTQEEMVPILQNSDSMNDIGFFLSNLTSLQMNLRITEKMTKTDSINIVQELNSAAATQSSQNSTDK